MRHLMARLPFRNSDVDIKHPPFLDHIHWKPYMETITSRKLKVTAPPGYGIDFGVIHRLRPRGAPFGAC